MARASVKSRPGDVGWRTLLRDFAGMFYPPVCPVCHRHLVEGEEVLCMECIARIPRTYYHRVLDNQLANRLVDLKAPLQRAAAYYFYRNENPYSHLIRVAKYNGRSDIARALGRLYAGELRVEGFFNDIDALVAVPIHWTKQLRRGYNQSEMIAFGISDITGLPVYGNLRAARTHKTQTHRSAEERRRSLTDIFTVDNPAELCGKHLLLIDDIITTGSTVLSCARVLHAAVPSLRLSVLSLATPEL